ncbi:unnamed protein product [Closterium sp. NIES-53]
MGVQHHCWHLALAQAVWVRNRVEHASLPSGVTPYELAFRRKPDVSMVRVWGCMLQYMVPQSQRGGKLAPKARWGLHLGVSTASKGWTVLDLESNRLITTVEAVFYETLSLAGWKAWHQQEHGGHSMPYAPLPSLFPITLEEAEEEEEVVAPPAMPYVPTSVPTPLPPSVYPRVIPPAPPSSSSPPLAPPPPPPVLPSLLPPSIPPAPAPPSSSSSTAPLVGEGGIEVPPSVEITDGQRLESEQLQDERSMDGVQQSRGQEIGEQREIGEQQIGEERIEEQQMVDHQLGEQQTGEPQTGEQEMWGIRDGGRVLASGMITAPLRRSTRITRGIPPLKYAWALVVEPAGLDDEEEDEEWTDLDPDVVADPERQWDIAKMTVKEALGCWKGDKVKEAMDEEMRSLIEQGTWKLVPRPPGSPILVVARLLHVKVSIQHAMEERVLHIQLHQVQIKCSCNCQKHTCRHIASHRGVRLLIVHPCHLREPLHHQPRLLTLHYPIRSELGVQNPAVLHHIHPCL